MHRQQTPAWLIIVNVTTIVTAGGVCGIAYEETWERLAHYPRTVRFVLAGVLSVAAAMSVIAVSNVGMRCTRRWLVMRRLRRRRRS